MRSAVLEITVVDVLLLVWHESLCEGLSIKSAVVKQAIHSSSCGCDDIIAYALSVALLELSAEDETIGSCDAALTMLFSILILSLIFLAVFPAKYSGSFSY